MQLFRSLIFTTYMFLMVGVHATAIVLLAPFPHRWRFAMARGWSRNVLWVCKHLCGLDYVVEGAEHIPDEPCVVLIKHSSMFETVAELLVFPIQCWVIKRELMWIPFFGWGMALLKPIAINRGAGRASVTQVIKQGKERLADGVSVMIFPEGTRMSPGQTKRYGVSGSALAKAAGVNVLPVAHNAGDYWPRRGWTKHPGTIRICIGPPIDASKGSAKETSQAAQEWVDAKMREISVNHKT